MSRILLTFLLFVHLMAPVTAAAQTAIKGPLSYSLKEYGAVMAVALLGGIASWWAKVRKGEVLIWNITALIGELCISAFAGLMAFYLCENFDVSPLLTAAIVGMSGHAGAKGITWLETVGQKIAERRLGLDANAKDAP